MVTEKRTHICDLVVGREDAVQHSRSGPDRVRLDQAGILADAAFTGPAGARPEQTAPRRRLIAWFMMAPQAMDGGREPCD
jgi:hypothetical protein